MSFHIVGSSAPRRDYGQAAARTVVAILFRMTVHPTTELSSEENDRREKRKVCELLEGENVSKKLLESFLSVKNHIKKALAEAPGVVRESSVLIQVSHDAHEEHSSDWSTCRKL